MPLPYDPVTDNQLDRAIDTTSIDTLRRAVKDLCQDTPAAKEGLTKRLLVTEDQGRWGKGSDSEDSESEEIDSENSDEEDDESENAYNTKPKPQPQPAKPEEVTGSKRLRSRYAVCDNCEKEFDVTTNTATSCHYHDGDCEPDEDEFADHIIGLMVR